VFAFSPLYKGGGCVFKYWFPYGFCFFCWFFGVFFMGFYLVSDFFEWSFAF